MAAQPSLRSSAPLHVLEGFGGSQRSVARVQQPRSLDELADLFRRARDERLSVTFRGSGRSYGDASLNRGGLVVDNRGMDRVLSWDPREGVIETEPGLTIEGLWRRTLADGYWPAVVPGTMYPTIAGCMAMNIHGKNNFRVGPFGEHVLELDLMTPDTRVLTCSRDQNADVFRAVIAGAGLLGAITRVKLRLKPVESGLLRVKPIRSPNLATMFDQFEHELPDADYMVGWVDCFATGEALGRGMVHRADHLHAHEDPTGGASLHIEEQGLPNHIMGVPRGLLWYFMRPITNDLGLRLLNALKYRIPEPTKGPDHTYTQSHVAFAFLLDYVPNWRLAYGPHGFIQYQVFVPDATARDAMPEILRRCQQHGVVSYLGVLKRHRPDEFLMSHGLDGWSLAMDFPADPSHARRMKPLARELATIVLDAGGTFYFAKDSVLEAAELRRAYGDRLERFAAMKRRLDPEGLIIGDQTRRLLPELVGSRR